MTFALSLATSFEDQRSFSSNSPGAKYRNKIFKCFLGRTN